jgi:single stranded DNA-binding protein
MLNLTLVSNSGSDPAVGTIQKGTPMAARRMAINQFHTDTTTGERIESAGWFRVGAMGRLVDHAQRLAQGSRVRVIGRLDIGQYQSSEDEALVSYDVVVDELNSLSPRTANRGAGAGDGHGGNDRRQPPSPGNWVPVPEHPQPGGAPRTRRDDLDDNLPW